uniref:Uncharacterized protein n=1 Tax=Anguilla anguilla TaxID=7936 RepID=A0A0E9V9L6_ANGAN
MKVHFSTSLLKQVLLAFSLGSSAIALEQLLDKLTCILE